MKEDTKLTKQEQMAIDQDMEYRDYVRSKPKQTLRQMMELASALTSTGAYQTVEYGEAVLDTREIAGLSGCLHYEVYQEACRVVGDKIS